MLRFAPIAVLLSVLPAAAQPLPTLEEIRAKYVQALGGQAALSKVTTRAAAGTVEVPTYGAWGRYQEFAKAPDSLLRVFHFEGYAVLQRCFQDGQAWEESPDYGVEWLSGVRLGEMRRQAAFYPGLDLRSLYARVAVSGRVRFEDREAFEVRAQAAGGIEDSFWFDAVSGLLLGFEFRESFQNGAVQRARLLYEDYRPVDGVQAPHRIRYESPRLIWILHRQVAHNVPVENARFRKPE